MRTDFFIPAPEESPGVAASGPRSEKQNQTAEFAIPGLSGSSLGGVNVVASELRRLRDDLAEKQSPTWSKSSAKLVLSRSDCPWSCILAATT
jgi:hypothetical protein